MRRNIFIALIEWMAVVSLAAAQPPDTLWTQTFGGYDWDVGYSVQQTRDGGYIIAGYTESYGVNEEDFYLIKTDTSGIEQWSQTFGGLYEDWGRSVQQTSDGGYIIAGWTGSYGVGGDVWLIKTDFSGIEQWSHTFGGSSSDRGYSVQQTGDGGYIVAGNTYSYGAGYSYVYLIKTDASGIEQWIQTIGGSSNSDYGYSVQQTSDGGYIIAGRTTSYGAGNYDVYLIKTDFSGIEQWSHTFGGSDWDDGWSVQQTTDGGYIIAGTTQSYGAGERDVYLIKTDASGIEQWSQTFGGSSHDYGYSVQQTSEGGYIIAGRTASYGAGGYDFYLIKIDASGTEQWIQTFGGSDWDVGYSVKQTSDGGYIIAGYTESFGPGDWDVYLIKADAYGVEQWSQIFGGDYSDLGYSVDQTSDGGYIVAGHTESYGSGYDVYLIKTDESGNEQWSKTLGGSSDGGYSIQQTIDGGYIIAGDVGYNIWLIRLASEVGVKPENPKQACEFQLIPAFPNPFNPTTTLRFELRDASFMELSVFDITGCQVAELVNGWREAGVHELTFDGTRLTSGIYIAQLKAGDFSKVQKMVLVK